MKPKHFNLYIDTKIPSFKKVISVDSDKSQSIRSFIIGSIGQGLTTAKNILESDDVKSTISACRKLGVKIIKNKKGSYKIFGKGLGSFIAKKNTLINFGNSGTLARLLIGALTSNPNIQIKIDGDHSLRKRSMKKLINLMSKFGAHFIPANRFVFPLKMISSNYPIGIKYEAGVSAQLKSAVILAGLNSYGNTIIREKIRSRDHTEKILKKNDKVIKIKDGEKKIIKIFGKKALKPLSINVNGDPSSAAFFTALTILNKDSYMKIKNVGFNPTRTGFYEILKKHNAKIRKLNLRKVNDEISCDIIIKSSKLKSMNVPGKFYARMADEYPILFVCAALSKGTSVFRNIGDLVSKESNRILEMQKILGQIGIKSFAKKNELKIIGKGLINAKNKKIFVKNLGDHRICMSAFILSTLTGAKTSIKNFDTVFTSSPSFLKIMKSLGAKFEIQR